MTFIGFLAEKKDENHFESVLKKYLENINGKAMTVAINEKSISNLKSIRFETIIIDRNIKAEFEKELKEILKASKYLIINADMVNIENFKEMNLTVITYGFGNKCTVTASSVEEENTLICLQRAIKNIKNNEIEPQEISTNARDTLDNQYLNMAVETVKLLYNVN